MIIRGAFTSLTVAVYGDQMQPASEASEYEPRVLPHVEASPLSLALDPSRNADPTMQAKRLMKLIPNGPDLLLLTRLMFCLKPQNEDWDEPSFPHLYSDLGQEFLDWNLERAVKTVSRPVSDQESEETIRDFALRVSDCIVSNVWIYHPLVTLKLNYSPRTTMKHTSFPKFCHIPLLRHPAWHCHWW